MSLLQSIIAFFISPVIRLLIFLIFIEVIFSWLVAFNIIPMHNQTVRQLYFGLKSVTDIILDPIRRFLPPVGGMDFSPIVALLGLQWLNRWMIPTIYSSL